MTTKILSTAIFAITAIVIGFYPLFNDYFAAEIDAGIVDIGINKPLSETPRIQVALLLDTSGSMDGLIDQARDQLWQVVNEFSSSTREGVTPRLEVAVYEYGNSGIPGTEGHVRMVSQLTTELDQVSEALFSLTTNGGNEYCGYAIRQAVTELDWSRNDNDIKTIFIAGNEPFTQGPVMTAAAIAQAKRFGISVNTIHAGDYDAGVASGWREGALLAGGEYMNIDHNHRIVHQAAPQDGRIAKLNARLNETYIPYGEKGASKQTRQRDEDVKSLGVSAGYLSKRAMAKASAMYDNSSWDLVDALSREQVELDAMDPEELPPEMRDLDKEERNEYVRQKAIMRGDLQHEIQVLSEARAAWVAEQTPAAPGVATIDQAIVKAVRKEGEQKNYAFVE